MLKNYLSVCLSSLCLSIILGIITIPLLRKLKAGQTVLKYVETHKDKNGTPTMGGLFFIVSAIIIYYISGGKGGIANVCIVIGSAFMAVGFLDDFTKIRFKQNEGLKAYQKIIFQSSIAIIAGVFAFRNGISVFYLPFCKKSLDLGVFTIPIVSCIFIAITNSVNLTDGLDGLAGSVSAVYLVFISILIVVQTASFEFMYLKIEEYNDVIRLCACLIGGLLGFLVFNVNKAKVFMGDTGSLSLGGFLGAISIFSSNSFFIPVLGIMFVLSSISVIVQVLHFKRTKKRIFLMAPLHHHFQLKGYTEAQISFYYSLITAIMGAILIIFYV